MINLKNINYLGSLVEDLNTLQNKNDISYFDIILLKPSYILQFLLYLLTVVFIKTVFKRFSFGTVLCLTSAQLMNIVTSLKEEKRGLKKRHKEVKQKVKEFARNISDDENIYKSIKHSVVFENIDKKEEMDRYIEFIISDVFYIDENDKIAILREVKSLYDYKDSDVKVTSTELFELETSEIPTKDKLPVKQVLRLK